MKTRGPQLCILLLLSLAFTFSLSAREIYRITVACEGSGDFKSVQEAVGNCKSFPDNRLQEVNSQVAWCVVLVAWCGLLVE